MDKAIGLKYKCLLFIFLNAVKLTAFNFLIMPSKTFGAFTYKVIFALLVNLIIFSLFFKIKSRWPFIILYAIQTIYIFSNLSYFKYFGGYLHLFQASSLLTEGVGPIRHFTIPVNLNMLVMLIDMPFFISLAIHYNRIGSLNKLLKTHIRTVRYVSILLILCLEGLNYSSGCSLIQLNRNFFSSETKIIERYGTFINNVSDLTVNYGGANLIKHFKYGETISAFSTASETPNIVAIQVESMDSNVINQKYKDKYIAPYLHSLSQENIYYPYVLSYHKAGATSDSEFSIVNSIEPLSNYPSIKIPKYDYPNSFVKQLTGQNYYTMAFHGNTGNYYNRDVAFVKMDFNEFDDIKKMNLAESGWGAPDDKVFEYAYEKMMEKKSPSFTYVITMSSHMPFANTAGYYSNNSYDSIEDETVRNYFISMSYVDKSIEEFVKKIKTQFPKAYILIWGDHTPGINAAEYKQASFTADNSYFEFVPLIISTPDKKVYKESGNVASFLDIAPTILNAAGIKFSIKSNGINLIDLPSNTPEIPFKEKLYNRSELYKMIAP